MSFHNNIIMWSTLTTLYIFILSSTRITWTSCKKSDTAPMIAKTVHTSRITGYGDCPDFSDKPFIYDVNILYQNNQHYVSSKYNLTDFQAKRIVAIIDRCIDYNYGCEYFQTWNTTDYCLFAKMKNQAWTEMFEAVTPSNWLDNCPRLRKGTYTVHNATVKADSILLFYPQAKNYHWKVRMFIYDQTNQPKYCYYMSLYILSFTKRIPLLTKT